MPGAEAIVAALAGTLARRARSGRAASRARVALVHGRVSIVERLVPAASSGTLSCASDRACALTPCRSTVTTSPVPARSAVSDLAPHASMSKAALSSNFVPQIETRTAFEEAALAIPAGG